MVGFLTIIIGLLVDVWAKIQIESKALSYLDYDPISQYKKVQVRPNLKKLLETDKATVHTQSLYAESQRLLGSSSSLEDLEVVHLDWKVKKLETVVSHPMTFEDVELAAPPVPKPVANTGNSPVTRLIAQGRQCVKNI